VDLNVRVLLESMTGDVPTGVIDRATGERLNRQIRKGAKQAAGVPARNSRRGTRPRRRSSGRLRRSRPVVGPSPAAASARVVDRGLSMLCRRCSRRAGPAQGRDRRGAASGVLACFEVVWWVVGGEWVAGMWVLGPVCWDAARDVERGPGCGWDVWMAGWEWVVVDTPAGANTAGSSRGATLIGAGRLGCRCPSVRTRASGRAGAAGTGLREGDPRLAPPAVMSATRTIRRGGAGPWPSGWRSRAPCRPRARR
jgi:hypothetical protein